MVIASFHLYNRGQTSGRGCAKGWPHHREHWTESVRVARRLRHGPLTCFSRKTLWSAFHRGNLLLALGSSLASNNIADVQDCFKTSIYVAWLGLMLNMVNCLQSYIAKVHSQATWQCYIAKRLSKATWQGYVPK